MSGSSARLAEARASSDRIVLEGFHPLKHALRFGAVLEEVYVADEARLHALANELAPDVTGLLAGVRVIPVGAERLSVLAGGRSHGTPDVLAVARRPSIDTAVLLREGLTAPIIFLEEPTHLGNIGAVVRVAAAAGAGAVLTSGGLDPWHAAALRGSAGLHFALPVARIDDARQLLDSGRAIVAADPEGDTAPGPLPARAIVALGSERRGLTGELLACARVRVRIPMREGVSSLNLATAAAVLLYARSAAAGSIGAS